jgi:hypothetical protein
VKEKMFTKTDRLLVASAAAISALTGSAALAQGRGNRQGHTQFDGQGQPATRI